MDFENPQPTAAAIDALPARDNALALYPGLHGRLWKPRARLTPAGLIPKP